MSQNEQLKIDILSEELQFLRKSDSSVSDENEEHLLMIEEFFKKHKDGSAKSILEAWIDDMNKLGKGNGPSSFNFYPSEDGGVCHELCIGVATKKFGHNRVQNTNRTGFEGLIKDLIGQWFRCSITRNTVILTMDWDEQAFVKEWIQILNEYVAASPRNKNVKIYHILDYPVGTYNQKYPRP